MGPAAVPLILSELRREPDHWFVALKRITGDDPVPDEVRGNIEQMAEAWLRWGTCMASSPSMPHSPGFPLLHPGNHKVTSPSSLIG